LVNGLTYENLELKQRVQKNEQKLKELEEQLPKIEELIKVLKDSLNGKT
jgi:hypothetical protein